MSRYLVGVSLAALLSGQSALAAGCNYLDATDGNLLPKGYLSTNGNQIVGADGKAVRLTSVGVYNGYDTIPNAVAGMKAAGFNSIRLNWTNATMATDLKLIDQYVAAASAVGMKVIINNHTNEEGHSAQDNYGAQQVNGLWYDVGGASDGTDGGGNRGTVSQEKFKADWVSVAQHYAGNSTVIGFDIRNEPLGWGKTNWGSGDPNRDLRTMYESVGNAVQAVNPGALIIAEGPMDYSTGTPEGDLSKVPSAPVRLTIPNKVVYSPHEYPGEVSGLYQSPAELVARMNKAWGATYNAGFPIWIGEMGSSMTSQDGQTWAQTTVDYMNGKYAEQGGPKVGANEQGPGGDWWAWGSFPNDHPSGTLNPDGSLNAAQEAIWMQMMATGCGIVLPKAPPLLAAAMKTAGSDPVVQDITQPSDPGIPADRSGLITPMPTVDDIAKLAVANADLALPSDVATLASIAAGDVPTEAAPTGDYTPPVPPTTPATPITVATDFGKLADVSGPHTITVTGNGNVVSATGGPQTVTVAGVGNAIRTGLFNDTITVNSSGNTIDGGGGEDLVRLVYPTAGAKPPELSPALAGLAIAGNVFVAPPPGQGVLTIIGQLDTKDRINLSRSVAGIVSSATLPYAVAQTANGSIISVGGKPVVVVVDGSPTDNIAPLISTKALGPPVSVHANKSVTEN